MSLSKSEIARANGAKSRGPVTPEGKARSAINAVRHGLTAHTLVLPTENREAYELLRDQYYAHFDPFDDFEADLVDQLLAHRWGMLRVETAQRDLLELGAAVLPDARASAQNNAMFSNPDAAKTLSLYLRYRGHYAHAFNRTLRNLERLQAARCKAESEPAAAEPWEPTGFPRKRIVLPPPGTPPPPHWKQRNEPTEAPPPPPIAPVPAANPPNNDARNPIK